MTEVTIYIGPNELLVANCEQLDSTKSNRFEHFNIGIMLLGEDFHLRRRKRYLCRARGSPRHTYVFPNISPQMARIKARAADRCANA